MQMLALVCVWRLGEVSHSKPRLHGRANYRGVGFIGRLRRRQRTSSLKIMENEPQIELSKKERKELRREQRLEEKQKFARHRTMKRVTKIALIVIIVGGSVGSFVWYLATRPPIPEGEILSRNGLHWHPELAIFVKGEKQEIPANLGIGAVHNPMHTHDSSGVIHLEFQGVVRKDDLKLGRFSEVWGKDFMELGSSVKMTVNGEENAELQNYDMRDGDKIELRYE